MSDPERIRHKIANIYLNEETHATLKALAAHQESTIQGTAAHWLEEIQPIMQDMVQAFDDIKNSKNAQNVLQNLMASGLQKAADQLKIEDEEDVTDNGSGD